MDRKQLISLAQTGDSTAQNRLIQENAKLIWSIVHRFSGRGVELEDLFQIGSIGFVKAFKGYDASMGTEFSTYAVPKIMGEIRRFFRDDGMIKVSRDLKQKGAMVRGAISRLEQSGKENPRLSDIAEATGLGVEEVAQALCATDSAYSLDAPLSEDGLCLGDTLSAGNGEDNVLDKLSLRKAVENLPDTEKQIIYLRFFKDLTQQKTGAVMGMSQVQVSRAEKRAIEQMRKVLL